MRNLDEEQRRRVSEDAKGKVVESLEWCADDDFRNGGYWVMTFTDGSEICFRFMAELV